MKRIVLSREYKAMLKGDRFHGRARPALVEFSFRYGNKQGEYQRATAQWAYDVFRALPKALAEWLAPKWSTKTGYVFSRA